MSVQNFEELAQHQGHKVEVVVYGDRQNSAVECVECSEVLLDFDNSISWGELADLTHETQVARFGFCTCEDNEGNENPYADCPEEER
jgi:hypothetical protein